MSKSQVIIIIIGVLSVILLFNLPKIIVKPEKQLENQAVEASVSNSPKPLKEVHTPKFTEKEVSMVDKLRKSLFAVSNKEKRSIFADSLVVVFRNIHQYDSAGKYSEMISELQPTTENWAKTADIYVEAFNFAEDEEKDFYTKKSREYYKKVLDKEPRDFEVKSKLALTYIGSENPMQGIKMLREIIQEDPKNETALYNLGILSIQSGQHDKAVKRFEELLEINPKHSAAQFYLGVALAGTGDKSRAIESLKKARELNDDPEFRATVDSYIKELQ